MGQVRVQLLPNRTPHGIRTDTWLLSVILMAVVNPPLSFRGKLGRSGDDARRH
jgi:hypothetical protein